MFSLEKKLIKAELKQRGEEGCNTEDIAGRIAAELEGEVRDSELSNLYDELMALPVDGAFPYTEPSTLEEIRAERPDAPRKLDMTWNDDSLYNQVYGAWLGRAAGWLRGIPSGCRRADESCPVAVQRLQRCARLRAGGAG